MKTGYLLVGRFLPPAPKGPGCDVLVAATCDVDANNSSAVWKTLAEKGLRVETDIWKGHSNSIEKILKCGFLGVDAKIPCQLFYEAAYSKYLVHKHNPKVICCFYSAGAIPTFLRDYMRGCGTTIYIPHGIINHMKYYTSIDYDYYFLFGEGSLRCLLENEVRFGSTRVIKTGSPMVLGREPLQRIEAKKVLFFSSWDLETRSPVAEGFRKDFEIFLEWAGQHPEFDCKIKLHPVESGEYVREKISGYGNIAVLPKSVSLMEALSEVSIALTMYSVASIEAALYRKPTITINHRVFDEQSKDYAKSDSILKIEKFLSRRATSAAEVQERVNEIYDDYDEFLKRCDKYADYHLERKFDSIEYIASLVEDACRGKELSNCLPIVGNWR